MIRGCIDDLLLLEELVAGDLIVMSDERYDDKGIYLYLGCDQGYGRWAPSFLGSVNEIKRLHASVYVQVLSRIKDAFG